MALLSQDKLLGPMNVLNRIPMLWLALVAGWLAVAPIWPEPHLIEKLRMLLAGTLVRPLDMFDLLLAKKNACMACHAVEKKLVGPAFQDISKKYASQNDAEAALVKSIKAGGSGKWGPIPMPAQAALSDADAKTLAAWVLAGAK